MISRILVLFVLFSSSAQACQRCGIFGLRCRFNQPQIRYVQPVQKVYAAPVVQQQYVAPYVAPVVQYAPPEVFVVQNNYPPGNAYANLMGQQGNTNFSFQEASYAYRFNVDDYIRSSERIIKDGMATLSLAINARTNEGLTAMQLQSQIVQPLVQSKAAVDVLNAAGINQAVTQTQVESTAYSFRIVNGKPEIIEVDPQSLPAHIVPPIVPPAPVSNSMLAQKCAKCHGVNVVPPKGEINIDQNHKLDCRVVSLARRKVLGGKMPPPSEPPLTKEEKDLVIDELYSLEILEQED